MAMEAPALPTRFPCWCQAVYSWGGETKRDLGFVEGDLIECLNAGDGAWWMGRLRRDRRMVGLFPSNFVKLLDESLWPGASRNPSPLVNGDGSVSSKAGTPPGSATPKPAPQKAKSTFRKPFQAYYSAGSPNPAAAARERLEKNSTGSIASRNESVQKRPFASMKKPSPAHSPAPSPRSSNERIAPTVKPAPPRSGLALSSRVPSPAPPRQDHQEYDPYRPNSPAPPSRHGSYSRAPSPGPSMHYGSRAPSPAPPMHYGSRAPSPAPPTHYGSRAPSPQPYFQHGSRAPSPNPPMEYRAVSPAPSFHPPQWHPPSRGPSRGPTPGPYEDGMGEESPPPPPPPPHRVNYNHSRASSPAPYAEDPYRQHGTGYHTPEPHSPKHHRFTPSPLTNAMNDVMSSLQDMGDPRSPSPSRSRAADVWSPETFDQVYTDNARKMRPQTSLGIGHDEAEQSISSMPLHGRPKSVAPQPEVQAQVGTYVQRMEERLRKMHNSTPQPRDELFIPPHAMGPPPQPPPKNAPYHIARPQTSCGDRDPVIMDQMNRKLTLKHRKSAYEVSKEVLGRTFTTKTNITNSTDQSNSTNSTNHTLWSGESATGMSTTSSGSFARRKWGIGGSIREKERSKSVIEVARPGAGSRMGSNDSRPETPFTGVSYHSSHASMPINSSNTDWTGNGADQGGLLGGFQAPRAKKSGFFKKMIASAKTGAANARSTIASSTPSRPQSRGSVLGNGVTSIAGPPINSRPASPVKESGTTSTVDWVQVRRDVNRSNSLSMNERIERQERCELNEIPVVDSIEVLYSSVEGEEGTDTMPVADPADFSNIPWPMVDKNARFITNPPPTATAVTFAQGHVCRPFRSDAQRLRAIFTWVSERIVWEDEFEGEPAVDTTRTLRSKRGSSMEVAYLVADMCQAVGITVEVIRGYLKAPGEILDYDTVARTNHYWNGVLIDDEWRLMDCSLASPTNPKRSLYSSVGSQVADAAFFLARPLEICYTHVPLLPEWQHLVPPQPHEVLMALPFACAPYFKNDLQITDFDTSLLNLENLEMAHIHFFVPENVEAMAEVEARVLHRDDDGDLFESGDVCRKRALCQAEWVGGRKRYTVKAILPGDEGQGVLKVYAGGRGLIHSIKSNPHPLAFALPLTHTGTNPPYDFLTLHPTPHAQRHDLYVAQPQCARLAVNNTFVFCVRQHPSSLSYTSTTPPTSSSSNSGSNNLNLGHASPNPFARPTSALSMISASVSNQGSSYSNHSSSYSNPNAANGGALKPAKLAIQSPSGKIIRLMRKSDHMLSTTDGGNTADGSVWETIIKIGERGTWRGLVLADRSARWCVFAEWECV